MNIITGKTGTPHVTAQQQREIHMGLLGKDGYVLDVGTKFDCEQRDANTLRIKDGMLIFQGCAASIDAGDYEDVTISNGTLNKSRIDLIVARYTRDTQMGTENMSLEVITGEPAESPTQPEIQSGTIRDNDIVADFPIYAVKLADLAITSITPLFSVATGLQELSRLLDAQKSRVLWNTDGPLISIAQDYALSENISEQHKGIVLVFSGATPEALSDKLYRVEDYHFSCHFIPKEVVATFPGKGYSFLLMGANNFNSSSTALKYLYISDNIIKQHELNTASGTGTNGIVYNNDRFCLRMVIGV